MGGPPYGARSSRTVGTTFAARAIYSSGAVRWEAVSAVGAQSFLPALDVTTNPTLIEETVSRFGTTPARARWVPMTSGWSVAWPRSRATPPLHRQGEGREQHRQQRAGEDEQVQPFQEALLLRRDEGMLAAVDFDPFDPAGRS